MLAKDSKNRPPPQQVRCLLPIWGFKYVDDFLNVSLPTWLAPGNLPAIAAALPTEFVFLTSREDEPFLTGHPGFKRLSEVCKVTMHYVDHLITGSNYSTTITLSYLEAVREMGDEMLDTCFFFLVSDYIVANGSFGNALQKVIDGASGVLTGNFQLAEESARPWLDVQISRSPETLSLTSRELMRWGLAHLHPNTVANTINFALSHNSHTNRLFWSVDSQSLMGRFFLMHMICIRPELTDFTIGGPCDYSFIPEMCPSDNVEIITDSDEYLVLELQPTGHESDFLRPGMQRPKALANTLGHWVTARHRKNSETTILFHAGDVPAGLDEISAEADRFLEKLRAALPRLPVAHRGHPYWSGAIAAQRESTGAKLKDTEWPLVFGVPDPRLEGKGFRRIVSRIFYFAVRAIFGRPPDVRRWHSRWPDYRLVLNKIRAEIEGGKQLLLVTDLVTPFTAGLPDGSDRIVRMKSSMLMRRSPESQAGLAERFDVCLIELREHDFEIVDRYAHLGRADQPNQDSFLTVSMGGILDFSRTLRVDSRGRFGSVVVPLETLEGLNEIRGEEIIDRVAPLMRDGGKIMVSILGSANDRGSLATTLAKNANQLVRPYAVSTKRTFVGTSNYRSTVLSLQMRLAGGMKSQSVGSWAAAIFLMPWMLVSSLLVNSTAKFKSSILPGQALTSALFEIVTDAGIARNMAEYSSHRLLRERLRRRRGESTVPFVPDETIGRPYDLDFLLSPGDGRVSHTQKLPANHAGAKEAPND